MTENVLPSRCPPKTRILQLTRLRVLLMLVLAVTLTGSSVWYVMATSAPSRNTNIEPGFSGFCTDMIFTDGTTPVDHPTNGGTNTVGTAGQDPGAFLTAQLANNKAFCYEPGVYTFTSTVTISQSSDSIICSSIGENAAGTTGTILRRSGNGDLFDVSGAQFMINGCALDTTATQTSGIGLSITGYNARVININIGNIVNSQQYFYKGIVTSSQYSFYDHVFLNNIVDIAFQVTGTNDQYLNQIAVQNWGANIFAHNPIGLDINNTNAIHVTDLLVGNSATGIIINPGTNQEVIECYLTGLDIVNNWGMGMIVTSTGNGQARQCNITNGRFSSNLQASNPTQNPSVEITNMKTMTWADGEIGGNPWGGIVINGTSVDVDFYGVQIRDNNQGNHLGTGDGNYAGVPTPGMYIQGSSVGRIRMVGGSLDNPGIGVAVGKQGGLYIATLVNGTWISVSMDMNQANPFGCLSCTKVTLQKNPGYNPQGQAAITVGASPFTYTNNDVFDENVCVSGGTVSAISLQGATATGQTAGCFYISQTFIIKVTYSVLPTMVKIPT